MRRLYRSSRDRKIFGVCGGLAEYLHVDATLLRILLIVVAVFSAGSVVLVYAIAGFVIPQEPNYGGGFGGGTLGGEPPRGKWSGGMGGWTPPQQPPGHQPAPGWTPRPSAWQGPTGAAPKAEPVSSADPAKDLDAMMEDIEKKSLKREIEELKARISKFEQQSKGE